MTIHAPDIAADPATPSREEAEQALATLRAWAEAAPEAARAALYPDLARDYPEAFAATEAYRATLPDLQNGPESLIRGARRRIQHVGISNFRVPLAHPAPGGTSHLLDTSVSGSVSLAADAKGINMSRIMRSFYAAAEGRMGRAAGEAALDAYRRDLDSPDARLILRFAYPAEVPSLRSGLAGWQYYDAAWELVTQGETRLRVLHLDYVYSSTCPCSLELAEHARRTRGQLATPHSQRSVTRLSAVLAEGAAFEVADMIALSRRAMPTETQVMVKREDEQAFAELNAANPIFVEDAARLFAEALQEEPRLGDFRVVASHQESLHSHDAVSVLTEGDTFAGASLDPHLFASLIHRG